MVSEFVYVYWSVLIVNVGDFVIWCDKYRIIDDVYQLVFQCIFIIIVRLWCVYEFYCVCDEVSGMIFEEQM